MKIEKLCSHVFLLVIPLFWIAHAAALPAKPNIVIVLTDDLGYGDVSFLNPDSKIQTPHMDALAHEGVYLTDAHSPSAVCSPTRYSILTGIYAWRNPVLRKGVLMPWDRPAIKPSQTTIPSYLKKSGYATVCIGKWHLGFNWPWKEGYSPKNAKRGGTSIATKNMFDWTKPITGGPLAAGFDYYFGDDVPNFPPYAFIENNRLTSKPVDIQAKNLKSLSFRGYIHGNGPGKSDWEFDQVMPTITRKAVDYIGEMSTKKAPFFLWFATTSSHTPVVPTSEFHGKSAAGYYGDYVIQTDHSVGQIVQALKKNNCFQDTLLIVTSDNGPSTLVRSIIDTHNHLSAGIFRGMKGSSWEGGHRVPFIASWPQGGINGGKRIDDLISLTDINATLASLAGIAVPDSIDSLDIMKTLKGTGKVRTEMVYHNSQGNLGLRQNQWVLLEKSGGKEAKNQRKKLGIQSPDAPIQLFNLADDPTQRVNLAVKYPELVSKIKSTIKSHQRKQMKTQ